MSFFEYIVDIEHCVSDESGRTHLTWRRQKEEKREFKATLGYR